MVYGELISEKVQLYLDNHLSKRDDGDSDYIVEWPLTLYLTLFELKKSEYDYCIKKQITTIQSHSRSLKAFFYQQNHPFEMK